MPLTELEIKNAKPRATPLKLTDDRGLFLLVTPAGNRIWRWRYRFERKEKMLALGSYPETSLKVARMLRDAARIRLAQGCDPSADRKAQKHRSVAAQLDADGAVLTIPTLETVATEFIELNRPKWTPYHSKYVLRRLQRHIFEDLGRRPINEITGPELLAAIRKIEAAGTTEMSHRTRELCSQVFRFGIASGYCMNDPAHAIMRALVPHVSKPMKAVSVEEFPALLSSMDRYDGHMQTRLGLQLIALTFLRTREFIGGEWTEIDFEKKLWSVPAARMKMKADHMVPLAPQAIRILEDLRDLNASYQWIFPGLKPKKPMSTNTLIFALYRCGYHSKQTIHGLRSLASTILNEARKPTGERMFDPDAIERQLAHAERDPVRAAYNRAKHWPERVEMMAWWADHLDELRKAA
jgi:integrase